MSAEQPPQLPPADPQPIRQDLDTALAPVQAALRDHRQGA